MYVFTVRLKHANDEKSTTWGREFHTFITLSLSTKKFLRIYTVFVVCVLNSLYAWPVVFDSVSQINCQTTRWKV